MCLDLKAIVTSAIYPVDYDLVTFQLGRHFSEVDLESFEDILFLI